MNGGKRTNRRNNSTNKRTSTIPICVPSDLEAPSAVAALLSRKAQLETECSALVANILACQADVDAVRQTKNDAESACRDAEERCAELIAEVRAAREEHLVRSSTAAASKATRSSESVVLKCEQTALRKDVSRLIQNGCELEDCEKKYKKQLTEARKASVTIRAKLRTIKNRCVELRSTSAAFAADQASAAREDERQHQLASDINDSVKVFSANLERERAQIENQRKALSRAEVELHMENDRGQKNLLNALDVSQEAEAMRTEVLRCSWVAEENLEDFEVAQLKLVRLQKLGNAVAMKLTEAQQAAKSASDEYLRARQAQTAEEKQLAEVSADARGLAAKLGYQRKLWQNAKVSLNEMQGCCALYAQEGTKRTVAAHLAASGAGDPFFVQASQGMRPVDNACSERNFMLNKSGLA